MPVFCALASFELAILRVCGSVSQACKGLRSENWMPVVFRANTPLLPSQRRLMMSAFAFSFLLNLLLTRPSTGLASQPVISGVRRQEIDL